LSKNKHDEYLDGAEYKGFEAPSAESEADFANASGADSAAVGDETRPVTDAAGPVTDDTGPVTDAAGPVTRPVTSAAGPVTDDTGPVTRPVTQETRPVTSAAQRKARERDRSRAGGLMRCEFVASRVDLPIFRTIAAARRGGAAWSEALDAAGVRPVTGEERPDTRPVTGEERPDTRPVTTGLAEIADLRAQLQKMTAARDEWRAYAKFCDPHLSRKDEFIAQSKVEVA
jgi:hypothetical protein